MGCNGFTCVDAVVMILTAPSAEGELRVTLPPHLGSTTSTASLAASLSAASSPSGTPLASRAAGDAEEGTSDAEELPSAHR